jgi:hypothetical protein
MGKSFRKERSGWDDDGWGRASSKDQRDERKRAKEERDARRNRRTVNDRVDDENE